DQGFGERPAGAPPGWGGSGAPLAAARLGEGDGGGDGGGGGGGAADRGDGGGGGGRGGQGPGAAAALAADGEADVAVQGRLVQGDGVGGELAGDEAQAILADGVGGLCGGAGVLPGDQPLGAEGGLGDVAVGEGGGVAGEPEALDAE